jgi:hypothetical protein
VAQSARTASLVAQEEDVVGDQCEDRGSAKGLTRREAVTVGLALATGGVGALGSTRRVSAVARRQGTPAAGAPVDHAERAGEAWRASLHHSMAATWPQGNQADEASIGREVSNEVPV